LQHAARFPQSCPRCGEWCEGNEHVRDRRVLFSSLKYREIFGGGGYRGLALV
jgi:hypothetical protein